MSLHEREGQRDTQIHTYTYWRILRYMLNTRIEMIKMYFCYIYIYINISLYGESYMIRNDVFTERESYMSLLERERQRERDRQAERERHTHADT